MLRPHGGSVSGLDPGLGAVMLLSGVNGRPDIHGVGGWVGGTRTLMTMPCVDLHVCVHPACTLSLRLCQQSSSVAPFQNNLVLSPRTLRLHADMGTLW